MIDKIISWLFMFIFTVIVIFSIVGCWATFLDENYVFAALFAIVIPLCILMMLIIYTQDFG